MISQADIDAFQSRDKRPTLVGINGLKGSGKSEAASVLVSAGWKLVKFAQPLKDMLRAIGLDDRHIEGDLKEVPCDILDGCTPRWAMQSLGTEWGRDQISENLWLNIGKQRIAAALADGYSVVVDDMRFENEARVIREFGGLILRVERGGVARTEHPSEAGVAPDMVLSNNGSLAELRGFMNYVFLHNYA